MGRLRGVILDKDGVLEFHGRVCEGALKTVAALREKGIKIVFLTNSTMGSRKSCAERLVELGFNAKEEEVITASYATARYLERLNPQSCWVMLEGRGIEEFKGFVFDEENPEYIVLGDNRSRFDFETMNRVFRLLLKGSEFIVMIPELVDRSAGEPELNVGSWANMLAKASGVGVTYIGKPNPFIFELALESMGLPREEVIMVGDRVDTDVVGAKNAGMRSVLLRTGEFEEEELNEDAKPDYAFESIRDILGLF